MDQEGPRSESADLDEGVTRRKVLTGAGLALAGGLAGGVAAATVGTSAVGANVGGVATGPAGATLVELVCIITQDGPSFDGHGYLTAVNGLDSGRLFTGSPRDEAHAVFTITATGTLRFRSVEGVVHALDIDGELLVLTGGRRVARYALELQDVLTVIDTGKGLPVLNGEADQLEAGSLGGIRRFGRVGQSARFVATGIGNRTDNPTDPVDGAQATLSVAGSLIAT